MGATRKLSIALLTLLAAVVFTGRSPSAQQNAVTAIDMLHRASDANARLLKAYPKGFPLDATHTPHITMLQRYVQTADLDKLYAAVGNVLLARKSPTGS